VAADVNQPDKEQKKAESESKGFVDSAKQGIELIGLVPTVVGYFKITPQWFTPSPFYQPDILYCAAGTPFVTYLVMLAYLHRVGTPIEQWKRKDRERHFIGALAALVLGTISGIVYVYVVRNYPHSSFAVDVVQFVTWSGVFVAATCAFTAIACIWKAPKTAD
jgi:hypothetical protein